MPSPDVYPDVALIAGVDLSQFRGQKVMERAGGSDVTLPAWSEQGGGIYQDLLTALNGRGEHVGWGARLNVIAVAWDPFASMSAGIGEDDLLFINCTDPFDFALLSGDGEKLGFVAGVTYSSSVIIPGVLHQLKAPNDWVRGPVDAFSVDVTFDPSGTPVKVPLAVDSWHQDVVTLLRDSGLAPTSDEDEPTQTSLQYLDNLDAGIDSIVWGLDADGHTVISWTSASSALDISDWPVAAFRQLLGFTGLEVVSVDGSSRSLRSDNPAAGALVPERLAFYEQGVVRVGSAARYGARYALTQQGDYPRHFLTIDLRGPSTEQDQVTHFLRRWLPEVPFGAPVNLYREWGDPRRGLQAYRVDEDNVAYSRSRTSERDGRRGRVVGALTPLADEVHPNWVANVEVSTQIDLNVDEIEA